MDIVISGTGCVLPGDCDLNAWWSSALQQEARFGDFKSDQMYSKSIQSYGHISEAQKLHGREFVPHKQRRFAPDTSFWGVSAAGQALAQAGLLESSIKAERKGIFTASFDYLYPSVFSMLDGIKLAEQNGEIDNPKYLTECFMQRRGANPFTVIKSLNNNVLGIASISFGLKGDCGSFSGDAGAATAALNAAVAALKAGTIDSAVVIATGSYLSPGLLADFLRLGWLGERQCRPFDKSANGLILADGACALVLETAEHAAQRGSSAKVVVESISSTASCMNPEVELYPALIRAGNLRQSEIDFVVADGVGLAQHDSCELNELATSLPDMATTCVNGVSGILGTARGLLSVITAAQALERQTLPPVSGLKAPLNHDLNFSGGEPKPIKANRALAFNRELTHGASLVSLRLI